MVLCLEKFKASQIQGYIRAIGYLIEQGADVNAITQNDNNTPLSLAVIVENEFSARELLKAPEIDLSMKSKFHDKMLSPLELARKLGMASGTAAKIIHMLENVQQVQEQFRTQARKQAYTEAIAISGAQLTRLGAGSLAKTLAPADIQLIIIKSKCERYIKN